ncbi:hypothetical protein LMG3441_04496 [Achromobacter kerstersii]|uniref:Uncharacterized protein n=1 Tax=Achromobacter kerstersii TaxID=1353890 RepID=A0A6S7APC5_9BURK|nr:hypothetical protein LMG3441_04496 [Achromobacter kerstersii]
MRFPDCVAARRPLPAAIAWPDAMSGHFFGRKHTRCEASFPAGPPQGKSAPLGGRKRTQCARRGGSISRRAAPREKRPLGGQEAHAVRAPWGPYFMPKRPKPFMPPMARIIFAMPPFFICFIMPCICSN